MAVKREERRETLDSYPIGAQNKGYRGYAYWRRLDSLLTQGECHVRVTLQYQV
jgi:hypothetical protein